jgi:hypothetical protein
MFMKVLDEGLLVGHAPDQPDHAVLEEAAGAGRHAERRGPALA